MPLNFSTLAIPFFASTALAIPIMVLSWKRRTTPAATSLLLLMVAIATWSLAAGFEILAVRIAVKLTWAKLSYLGVTTTPLLMLVFALRYTGKDRWLTRRNLALLGIIPLASMGLAITNELHGLIWSEITPGLYRNVAIYDHGPAFWLMMVYAYLAVILATVLLAQAALRQPRPYSYQAITVLLGAALPWAANVIYLLNLGPVPGLDLTPCCFTLTGVLLALGIFRYQLFDLIPVGRDLVLEKLEDGVLVLDTRNRILDINPAARRLVGASDPSIIGQDAESALGAWLSPALRDLLKGHSEVALGSGDRFLEVHSSPLHGQNGLTSGWVLLLRDITERKLAEQEASETNARLQAQIAEIESLQARLREQAIRDGLTGLFNRRYLDETLARELARAAREYYPVSLVMIDVDHFKNFNDYFGHNAGDRMLQALAAHLRKHSRAGDIVCRYGGEEFMVVLPATSLEVATERAEEWRLAFKQVKVSTGGLEMRTTFSAGVASFPIHGLSAEEVLNAADLAMYQAKALGRNRVIPWGGGTNPYDTLDKPSGSIVE